MTQPVIALYPGTFDPITLGHEDIVRRAARMFDVVVIAVARAHHKKTMFTLEQRLEMTRHALADCPNVKVQTFDGLVIEFAKQLNARTMVRGIRSMTDLDVYQCISSTLVREVSALGGDVAQFVSPSVLAFMHANRNS